MAVDEDQVLLPSASDAAASADPDVEAGLIARIESNILANW